MTQHLFCHSVYTEAYPKDGDVFTSLERTNADGLELLTGHFPVDPVFKEVTKGIHLPYATDWYSPISGITVTGSEEEIRSVHFGKDRGEVINNLINAIELGSKVEPAYGVLHACSIRLDDIFLRERSYSDREVMDGLADAVNSAVSSFPEGEPPFTILLENMWWPGVKLLDDSDTEYMEKKLEFDNWGFCLDTGHLMNAAGISGDEEEAISSLIQIFDNYSERTKELIKTIHLHSSASAGNVENTLPTDIDGLGLKEKLTLAYPYVCKMDPHRPFTSPKCVSIVREIGPEFVTHELSSASWNDRISDFITQRSFF